MKERYTKKDFTNRAGGAGIALAILPVIYYFLNCHVSLRAVQEPDALPVTLTLLMMLFWLFKLAAGVFIMRFFMRSFVNAYDGVTISTARRFGSLAAVLSALIYATCVMAYHKFIDPEMIRTLVDYSMANTPIQLDSNTLSAFESSYDSIPVVFFITKFLYCTLYGMILSAVLCSRVGAESDIFNDSEQ